jgi:glycosyltransferase involved in cell wall biosynthesis
MPEPRTVLVLHRGGGQLRGSEDALLTLLEGIDRKSFQPLVLHSHPVLSDPLRRMGIEAMSWPFPELLLSPSEARLPVFEYLRSLRRMHALARSRRAELVLCNGGGPCQLGVPVARRLKLPLVCLLHHPAPHACHRAWLTRCADVLVFASAFTAAHTRERTGRDGVVVPIGIDLRGHFTPAPRRDPSVRAGMGIAPDEVVFAQVGALVPEKEHALLLHAFARVVRTLSTARLLVIGEGPETATLRTLAANLGLSSRVTFTGRVDDVAIHLRHVVDVNVLASREEGLGLVNLQASACAVPNVACDATGVREGVGHGRTGLLFPAGDAGALAAFMIRLGGDPSLRRRMGEEGRAFAVEHFSRETYCARMRAVLDDALRAHAARPAGIPRRGRIVALREAGRA